MLLNCGIGEDSWESLGWQGNPTSPSWRRLILSVHWKDWCWSWNSRTLATWCKELTHLKSPWCWERLRAGEGDDKGWDGWMTSLTRCTWVWVDSRSWWWTGRPGVLQFMRSQRVGHDWATKLNWTALSEKLWAHVPFQLYPWVNGVTPSRRNNVAMIEQLLASPGCSHKPPSHNSATSQVSLPSWQLHQLGPSGTHKYQSRYKAWPHQQEK